MHTTDKAALHIGAVALAKPQVHIHRFGSSLNGHLHFHVCAVDGVFEEVPGQGDADADDDADVQSSPPGIIFHPASAIDETAVAQVQTDLRRRILRAFVGLGLLESCDAREMLGYEHSGFSVDAGVCIEAYDRAALDRLLRYCARLTRVVLPSCRGPVSATTGKPLARRSSVLVTVRGIIFTNSSLKLRFVIFHVLQEFLGIKKTNRPARLRCGVA